MNRQDIAHQVSTTLGDHTEDFDIDAIMDDLVTENGPIANIDAVDSDTYWATVRKHDTSA
ncbi:hypothetical protein ACFRCX_30635 [Streptomyces sp. NPDC056652]|uniref:hypothetical protein n=1 Tax=Streptomyces sp. NPDC056652 TaxID=3345893 RepID=UPI00367B631C